ncbi:MAG TPA: glycosyltransferase family 4 protein [Verrucomicrobiae bacterium]|nr:glycosyltransferase family 4 protein [Verrucomicrobiae bacterium]
MKTTGPVAAAPPTAPGALDPSRRSGLPAPTQPAPQDSLPVVQFIGCLYKFDMYSHNCSNLAQAMSHASQANVQVTTSNCNCFSTGQKYGIDQSELIDRRCSAVKLPYAPPDPSRKYGAFKYWVVKLLALHFFLEILRGALFFWHTRKARVVHFDQVLKAFGFLSFFVLVWLRRATGKAVVVSVHEVDPLQRRHPRLNRVYNRCARVVVFSVDMKEQLQQLGVRPEKITIIHAGTVLPVLTGAARERFIFFGGHSILRGKGYAELMAALKLLKEKRAGIRLLSYVGKGCNGVEEAMEIARREGVSDLIEWKEFLYDSELAEAYQGSKACLIPYTGGSARHPATCAMSNATAVIATRAVDIPEYLGDSAIYTDGSARSLAEAVLALDADPERAKRLGAELRQRAEKEFTFGNMSEKLLRVCTEALGASGGLD